MSTISSIVEPFGFHVGPSMINFDTSACKINVLNLCGYFPLLGIYSAYSRFKMITPSGSVAFQATLITRGVLEGLGVGIIFLVLDLLVTIGRMSHVCYRTYITDSR